MGALRGARRGCGRTDFLLIPGSLLLPRARARGFRLGGQPQRLLRSQVSDGANAAPDLKREHCAVRSPGATGGAVPRAGPWAAGGASLAPDRGFSLATSSKSSWEVESGRAGRVSASEELVTTFRSRGPDAPRFLVIKDRS